MDTLRMRKQAFASVSLWLLCILCLSEQAGGVTVEIPVFNHFTSSRSFAHGSRTLEVDWISTMATLLAKQHVNARNDTLLPVLNETLMRECPINFSMTFYNTYLTPSRTIKSVVDILTTTSPHMVLSLDVESTTEPLSYITSAFSTPIIATRSTSFHFDEVENHPYFLRTVLSDVAVVNALADYLQQNELIHVNVIYVNDVHGSDFYDLLFTAAEERGITVHAFAVAIGGSFRESLDVALDAMALTRLNVNIALVGEVKELMEAALLKGLTGGHKLWMFLENFAVADILRYTKDSPTFKAAFQGSIVLSTSSADSRYSFRLPWVYLRGLYPEFLSSISGLNLTVAESVVNSTLTDAAALAYDAVVAIALGTCLQYQDNVSTLSDQSFKRQLSGTIGSRVNFLGLSGRVAFDKYGSREPSDHAIQLKSYRFWTEGQDVRLNISCGGVYNVSGSRWHFFQTSYPTGNDSPPRYVDEVVPYNHYRQLWELVLVRFLAGAIFVSSGLLFFWLWACRSRSVVRATQPHLLAVMLCGIVIATNTVFPLSRDEGQGYTTEELTQSCNQVIWLVSSGITLTSAAMLCKLYRVIRIFNAFKPMVVSVKRMLALILLVLCFDLALVAGYELLSPSHWVRETVSTDEYGQVTESVGSCKPTSVVMETTVDLVWAIVAFHCAIYAVAVYFCYLARGISSDFQDSQWVMTSIFSQLQLLLLGVPVYFAVQGEPVVTFVVQTLIILLFNVILLVCMFAPKVLRTHAGPTEVSLSRTSKKTSIYPEQSIRNSIPSQDMHSSVFTTPSQQKDAGNKRTGNGVAVLEPTKENRHEEGEH